MTDATSERGAWLLSEMANLSDAEPSDMGPRDIAAIRYHLDRDLFAFSKAIFGYPDLLPALHGDIAEWINHWGMVETPTGWRYYTQVTPTDTVTRDYRRLMTQIPREHYKTSLGTTANALWQQSRIDPDGVPGVFRPVAIFNEKEDNAKKWIRAIRSVVEGSVLYGIIYADLVPPGVGRRAKGAMIRSWKWTDLELDLNGKRVGEVEASLSAHGIESAVVGGHWPKMIFDDLISLKHKQSVVEMDRARQWIRNHTALMRPAENSCAYVNCTPWSYGDIYVDLVRSYNYKVYRRSALEDRDGNPSIDNGTPIAPNKFSTAQLQGMHKRDPFTFNSQFMCWPRPGEEQSFQPEWLRYFTIKQVNDSWYVEIDPSHYDSSIGSERGEDPPPPRVPLSYLDKCLILDPAPSEESQKRADPHARNAILVEAMDAWGRRYLLETWADRVGYLDVIRKCFQLSKKWSAPRLRVEEVNFSNVYRHWIRREQNFGGEFAGHPLQVLPLTPKKAEKNSRIMSREPSWRQGFYYVNQVGCEPFLTEYSEFPNGATVDLLDCMGYDAQCLTRPERPTETQLRRYYEQRGANYSDPYFESVREGY